MAYVVMRPHRFVFNLGYSVAGAGNAGMTSVGLLFTSMFIELCFEFVVDTVALQIESSNGEETGREEREGRSSALLSRCFSRINYQAHSHAKPHLHHRYPDLNLLDHVEEE